MSNAVLSTLCLLCVGICSLPGGDSNNFSLQRRPLDVSPLSAIVSTRLKRSLLAARVIDHHGNPVSLRGTGQPVRRRVINPFVTSQGRHHKPRTSGGQKRNFSGPTVQKRRLLTVQKPRQVLPGSRGFAMFNGQRYDIKPSRGLVPHDSWQSRSNQQRRYNAPANQNSRYISTTNQQRRYNTPANQNTRHISTNQRGRIVSSSNQKAAVWPQRGSGSDRGQHPQTGSGHPQTGGRHPQTGSRHTQTGSGHPQTTSRPLLHVGNSFYEHGLEAHMPLNARNMTTFLVQTSAQRRPYLDRTKGTGTIFTSHPGQCPVVDQSRCAPLPTTLPPSCGNDYQCHGQESKCCYDPCLTFNKCVRPVNG